MNVLSERPDGSRAVVSHFNKAHKGRLARALAVTRAEPSDAAGVAAVARRAGMRVERAGRRTWTWSSPPDGPTPRRRSAAAPPV